MWACSDRVIFTLVLRSRFTRFRFRFCSDQKFLQRGHGTYILRWKQVERRRLPRLRELCFEWANLLGIVLSRFCHKAASYVSYITIGHPPKSFRHVGRSMGARDSEPIWHRPFVHTLATRSGENDRWGADKTTGEPSDGSVVWVKVVDVKWWTQRRSTRLDKGCPGSRSRLLTPVVAATRDSARPISGRTPDRPSLHGRCVGSAWRALHSALMCTIICEPAHGHSARKRAAPRWRFCDAR